MKHIQVESLNDDRMEITIGKGVYRLKLRDFDEIVMNTFINQKRHYEEIILTSNDYKTTQNAMNAVAVLKETLEKITHALFVKCLSSTYDFYKDDIDKEFSVMSLSEFLSAIGVKETEQ